MQHAEPAWTKESEGGNVAERRTSEPARKIPLSAELIARMERDGPAAVARRTPAFFAEMSASSVELGLVSTVSLLALWSGTSPAFSMLYLLLASLWIGIASQWLKFRLLREEVEREAANANADRFVWAVASALKDGSPDMLDHHDHDPGGGLYLDILLGTLPTIFIIVALWIAGHGPWQAMVADPWLPWLIALCATLQLGGTVVMAHHWRSGGGKHAQVRFSSGGRGLALVMLMFLVLLLGQNGEFTAVVVTLCLVQIAWAGIAWYLVGCLREEQRWLSDYLRDRSTPAA